jgi:hypothetical protein
MPNLDLWINQTIKNDKPTMTRTINKFENYLLSIRTQRQKMICPNSHPAYNQRHQKIIKMINWALEKYKADMKKTKQQQQQNEHVIIQNIIDELEMKRSIAINKKKENLFRDEVLMYRQEENTLDYLLYIIQDVINDTN